MTKDVLIAISGLQLAEEAAGDQKPVEIITAGNYYLKNGKHYLIYDEIMEGFDGVTKNSIKFKEDYLEITKKGVANVHMVFEKNKKNVTCYETPYGGIMVGILAEDIQIKEKDEQIQIDVKYGLEMNYEHVADCAIKLDVKSKSNPEFRIMAS